MQNEELRRAQEELEASRARYFDLYDLAPVGYFTVSEQGTILEANLTAATLLGIERGTLLAQPLTRFVVPGDREVWQRHARQVFETGELLCLGDAVVGRGGEAVLGAHGGDGPAGDRERAERLPPGIERRHRAPAGGGGAAGERGALPGHRRVLPRPDLLPRSGRTAALAQPGLPGALRRRRPRTSDLFGRVHPNDARAARRRLAFGAGRGRERRQDRLPPPRGRRRVPDPGEHLPEDLSSRGRRCGASSPRTRPS